MVLAADREHEADPTPAITPATTRHGLEGRGHLEGEFTLADVAHANWLRFGAMLRLTLDARPWPRGCNRCARRPAAECPR